MARTTERDALLAARRGRRSRDERRRKSSVHLLFGGKVLKARPDWSRAVPEYESGRYKHWIHRGRLYFSVQEPRHTMKWVGRLRRPVDPKKLPILVLRYRARGLLTEKIKGNDYFLWLCDGPSHSGGCEVISPSQIQPDGKVHEVRVRIPEEKFKQSIEYPIFQVFSDERGEALLEIEEMAFVAGPPEEVLPTTTGRTRQPPAQVPERTGQVRPAPQRKLFVRTPYLAPIATRTGLPHRGTSYVIITTSDIAAQSRMLYKFIAHKKSLGFKVILTTEAQFGGGVGDEAAENIRRWLQTHYRRFDIKYVLFVGNAHPETGDVPMKMIYTSPWCKDPLPSDNYFADLTGNWDLNADGRYGEWAADFGPGGVDLFYEVIVGRIPYYGVIANLDAILTKTISYEKVDPKKIQWRKSALLSMPNKNAGNIGFAEGIKDNYLAPAGWRYHRIYEEDFGLNPPPETTPCSTDSAIDVWRNGKFGLAVWWGHGGTAYGSKTIETKRAGELNDDYPAFTVHICCRNAPPEDPLNLAYALLKNGAICTMAATRALSKMSWLGRDYTARVVVVGLSGGEALYETKAWQFGIGWNSSTGFNLYGDPSIRIDPLVQTSARRFVNRNAAAGGDGLSWETAHSDLQDALDEITCPGIVNEIWVAAGTYTPDRGTGDRAATFRLDKGVAVYGGFAGGEERLEKRKPTKNVTVLSGDIGVQDDASDNSYHVITFKDTWVGAVIDGFTITAGNANGPEDPDRKGGGIYNLYSNPTISNCTFSGNSAAGSGGAIYSSCKWNVLTLVNCVFSGNVADEGGALHAGSQARITHCTFAANRAKRGGAISTQKEAHPVLVNCILWDNGADEGGEIYNGAGGALTARYCDIEGSLNGAECDGAPCIDGGGNISDAPLFAAAYDPDGPDDIFGTADDGLRLARHSPCIDSADGDVAPGRDILGERRCDDRTMPNTGRGTPKWVDIGAYEFADRTRTEAKLSSYANHGN